MPRDMRPVLDALLDGAIVTDEWGLVRFLNDAACRILEISDEAVLGKAVEELHGREHALARLARTALESARACVEDEQRIERRLGGDVVVDVSASPIFDDLGNLDGAILVMRDRTVRRAIEADAAERERLALSGRIALGIAHEVKNPLGGIRGAGELLVGRAADAKTREIAGVIVREVDRIARLVDEFMVLARDEELNVEPVNVHLVLDEVLELLAHDPLAAGCQIERRYDPSIPNLPGDRSRLSQVFHNLVRNAFQAMAPAGGRLRIATRMSLDQRLATPDGVAVPTIAIEIGDSGPGLAPEVIGKVGTPFFTTRKDGTGLGLALADHWVTRHGGRLRLANAPGGGACARVFLPLRRLE
jgi:two-component system nitrogen regulation sensor histidine kinase GlnL